MKRLTLLLSLTQIATSSELKPIPLWSGTAPGEDQQEIAPEKSETRGKDKQVYTINVSNPTITLYPAPQRKAPNTAVVVAPGGGYNLLAWQHEGTEVCQWLNQIGVTAILLKYRVPRRQNLPKHHAPLQDAQRAISLVRSKAKEWNIDPKSIGMLGFSAGGHLTASTLTSDGTTTFPKESIDQYSPIPNFGILVYPAYLKAPQKTNQLAPEINITPNTPPLSSSSPTTTPPMLKALLSFTWQCSETKEMRNSISLPKEDMVLA